MHAGAGGYWSSGSWYMGALTPLYDGRLAHVARPMERRSIESTSSAARATPPSATYIRASSCAQPSPAKPKSHEQHGVAMREPLPAPHSCQSVVHFALQASH